MRAFIIVGVLAVLAGCSRAPEQPAQKPPADGKPTAYLASIVIPLGPGEQVSSFSLATWGVDILAVCHIPPGWRITGGGSAAPDGVIAGKSSHGVTWLGDMKSLEALVLVRLNGPIQREERKNDTGAVPATFTGKASLETDDAPREVMLGHANVRLTPASRCP